MSFLQFVFYFFSALTILSALGMIVARNPVHAVLFLVFAFFNSAALWITLQAEFLGIVLVLVYVGAVMVLFLFVVMMLDINIARMREGFTKFLPLAVVVALVMVVEMGLVVGARNFQIHAAPITGVPVPNTVALGRVLYTEYAYPFELAAVILLVAIVAAISLTFRRRSNTKYQRPEHQVQIRREDRVRLVQMPSEKKR
ncbi:NADH:ubiquinone oxidoreductase subunit J [Acidihalobacter yilgarnensis]|uniref:NADH-quinone oxidoreductase subunit J n=1 Tax=Acidihalobacter yilgarnensis TaxID=2819280 RepID=A0A1D8IM52_9GAMM|nr:NADH-quinone oxidoreductase subunit J [Acidihalobacter yilgarnensis]AOU97540.1 NADH:ubiquinone oxidoreductase subunit J [Acidihalobacter yilgarnensis]